jgi:feruloyl-CoA synthase
MLQTPPRSAPVRKATLGACEAQIEHLGGGAMLVRNIIPLGAYPERLTDRLDHWARVAPDRVWLAARDGHGEWRKITYGEGRARVRRIAASLLTRNLSPERPIVVLSGNGLTHALFGTAALYAGIPYAPVSPAYSLISKDFSKLRGIFELLTPGMVFVADARPFARAIDSVVPSDVELVVETNPPSGRSVTSFDALEQGAAGPAVDAAHRAIIPDTIAKFLFTSGSTGVPKAVINTQRMLCANAEQITAHFAYFRDEPPVTLDWAPWNHTAGGNHDFNLILYNGGTLYIDDGRPTPDGIAATVKNLHDVAPNWYFNVPVGYDALVPYLRADAGLRAQFFKNLKLLWYAGAGMSRHTWNVLDEMAIETVGRRITILTGLGATETAPFAMAADQTMVDAGLVGLPARACDFKLVPVEHRFEARVRGPNVTPGYWRQPELTREAFDEDGFYRLGDALRFADRDDVNKGFYFDGRFAESFKLATGTWVAVGPLRVAIINHCAPYIQDVVVAGLDRDHIAVLIFPNVDACRKLIGQPDASLAEIATNDVVRQRLAEVVTSFASAATGSSNRVVQATLLTEPPNIDSGEMTDKGSINQRAVLANRAAIVEALYERGEGDILGLHRGGESACAPSAAT